jgi:hypothetical protein
MCVLGILLVVSWFSILGLKVGKGQRAVGKGKRAIFQKLRRIFHSFFQAFSWQLAKVFEKGNWQKGSW